MGEGVDLIKEFKDAKPPEKAVILVGAVAVLGIGFYLYKKGHGQSAPASSATGAPSGQTSGWPMAGNNPVVPSGTNPLYDPNGNLIGWQNPPSPGTTPPPGGPPTSGPPQPQNWYTNILGKLGYGTKINPGGYDVNGQRFWTGKNQFSYAPIGTSLSYCAQGRVWIQPPATTSGQLLTGPGMTPGKTFIANTAKGIKQ